MYNWAKNLKYIYKGYKYYKLHTNSQIQLYANNNEFIFTFI